MFLVIILVLLSVILWVWWLKILNSGSGPMHKNCIPIIGFTHKIVGNTEKLWHAIRNMSNESLANGGVVRVIIALETYYVITDPEDLTTVGNNSLRKHFSIEFARYWLGDGLFTAPPPEWKLHRKLLNPAFSLPVLHGFLPMFNEQARELADCLASHVGHGPVDITGYFKHNAMKVLSRTALGLSKQEEIGITHKYLKAADEILEMVVSRFQNVWLHSEFVYKLFGLRKKESDLKNVLNKMSDTVINSKMSQTDIGRNDFETSETPVQKQKAFLDLLLELLGNNTLTEKEVREEVDTMLVAGTDTSSWMVIYILIVIGTYPEVQQKIYQELIEVLGDSYRDVTKDDLQKLVYLEIVMKETLRLYPVVPISLRTVETGIKLKNQYLHPGEHVIMSFYGLNRHPMWGADVSQFRPERWLENTLPNTFGFFGVGKRSCIGKTYAMLAMKTLLVHVLRRYQVAADVNKLKMKFDFIAKPVSGHLIAISERKSANRLGD